MPPYDEGLPSHPELGPYFALTPESALPDHRPLPELLCAAALTPRVEAAARTLGVLHERRVAASVLQLGLASRLISPLLAAATLDRRLPIVTGGDLRWADAAGSLVPLAVRAAHVRVAGARDDQKSAPAACVSVAGDPDVRARQEWSSALIDGPIAQLVAAGGAFGVSPTIGWGNVVSAANGALAQIRRSYADAPALAAEALVAATPQPSRHHTGGLGRESFRRRSCCLYYRAHPGGYCGDCVLARHRST